MATVIPRMKWTTCVVVALLSGQAAAQDVRPTVVREEPTCPECTVRLTAIMTPGGTAGSAKIRTRPARIAVDHAMRYWIFGAGVPLVFDSSGREIGPVTLRRDRTAGFRYPSDVVVAGDSLVVLDQMSQVAAIFGPDLAEAREVSFDLPVVRAKIVRWPDLVVGVGLLPTLPARGWPLHRMSFSGAEAKVVSSFGPGNGQLRAATPEISDQFIAPAAHGEFWSFRSARYRLARWDSAQRRVQVLERRPGWFPDTGRGSLGGPRTPPSPALSAVEVDSAGLLWVFVSVASETWPSAWPAPQPGVREVAASGVVTFEKLYRTAIEVIDPRAARVVTRAFTDVWICATLSDHRAMTCGLDAAGRPRLAVVSLGINRGESRR